MLRVCGRGEGTEREVGKGESRDGVDEDQGCERGGRGALNMKE